MHSPKDWQIVLHENMGWFWRLRHNLGHLTVSGGQIPYKDNPNRNFHAMLDTDASGSGCSSLWYDEQRFKDPNRAVEHRLKLANDHLAGVLGLLQKVNPVVGGQPFPRKAKR
jgi:hypothetical protein